MDARGTETTTASVSQCHETMHHLCSRAFPFIVLTTTHISKAHGTGLAEIEPQGRSTHASQAKGGSHSDAYSDCILILAYVH